MILKHYYHLYAAGHWQKPFTEHLEALNKSGLIDKLDFVGVGLVGSPKQREEAKLILPSSFVVVAEADKGFEQVTLDMIDTSEKAAILYAHTKGAANSSRNQDVWRQRMTQATVYAWPRCVGLLDQGIVAVGCLWREKPWQHFSGTFWWADSDYLATLPHPVSTQSRWEAECWISKGTPGSRVASLEPRAASPEEVKLKLDEDPEYITIIARSKYAGFIVGQPKRVKLTPFIKNIVSKNNFDVLDYDIAGIHIHTIRGAK